MPGPFYFAWVDEGTAFNASVHNVEDEEIFDFELSQNEGDFAALSITIVNPRIGLLKTGRKVWAWFSWFNGTSIVPLFYGRVVGIPTNVFAQTVTLDFTARPPDYADQKAALAETLKVAPYWDPIFVTPEAAGDPDTVLEARSQLWHVDRVTHEVTVSDILVGEDGVIEFDIDEYFDDSMQLTLGTPPARSVTMTATIPWTSSISGGYDISGLIRSQWPKETDEFNLISSFTFSGLKDSWPDAGKSVGQGWVVTDGSLTDVSYLAVAKYDIPFYYDLSNMPEIPKGSFLGPSTVVSGNYYGGVDGAGFNSNVQEVIVPIGWGVPKLVIGYAADRKYSEIITFRLNCDMQSIVTLPGEDDSVILDITANPVSDEIDGSVPIGDVRRRTFIDTDRGAQAVQHLIAIARANIVIKSRAVDITFTCPFSTGHLVTLRKNALVHNPKLPGGQAVGKIKSYSSTLSGDTGLLLTTVTIGCAVGYGGSLEETAGDPVWVEDDYVVASYQQHESAFTLLPTSDVVFSVPPYSADDDGFNAATANTFDVVESITINNGPGAQRALLTALNPLVDSAQANEVLQSHPTTVELHLKAVTGGPFATAIELDVSDLIIPKQIDLEADSV